MSLRSRCLLLTFSTLLLASPAFAEMPKPDDSVQMELSAENWVTTKTARVTVNVEAAVTGNAAGSMRASMTKAVGDIAKVDWKLTSFNRGQDSTGLERWSAQFEARLPESDLSGLNDAAKKVSKAGMQLTVASIDFEPTLDEIQATQGQVRTQIYKMAQDQLTALNAALPGRSYRIASIDFIRNGGMMGVQQMMMAKNMRGGMAPAMAMADSVSQPESMEKSEKITLTARVILSALPPASAK